VEAGAGAAAGVAAGAAAAGAGAAVGAGVGDPASPSDLPHRRLIMLLHPTIMPSLTLERGTIRRHIPTVALCLPLGIRRPPMATMRPPRGTLRPRMGTLRVITGALILSSIAPVPQQLTPTIAAHPTSRKLAPAERYHVRPQADAASRMCFRLAGRKRPARMARSSVGVSKSK
jgi:hypothetical protein